ncbi:MAG TPA: hypothetical protein VGE12_05600, partial [Noviherbaspirillum sp.]
KNLWSPSFLQPEIVGVVVGLRKSIRRHSGEVLRATMRVAPDDPKKARGFNQQPIFMSGYSSGRCAVHVIQFLQSQNQVVNQYC